MKADYNPYEGPHHQGRERNCIVARRNYCEGQATLSPSRPRPVFAAAREDDLANGENITVFGSK
jgi:hypothetical protein